MLASKSNADRLPACVTADAAGGEVLMLGWMDAAALRPTIAAGQVQCWSRSRHVLWRKSATSGKLRFAGAAKTVEPRVVHGDAPNPKVP